MRRRAADGRASPITSTGTSPGTYPASAASPYRRVTWFRGRNWKLDGYCGGFNIAWAFNAACPDG